MGEELKFKVLYYEVEFDKLRDEFIILYNVWRKKPEMLLLKFMFLVRSDFQKLHTNLKKDNLYGYIRNNSLLDYVQLGLLNCEYSTLGDIIQSYFSDALERVQWNKTLDETFYFNQWYSLVDQYPLILHRGHMFQKMEKLDQLYQNALKTGKISSEFIHDLSQFQKLISEAREQLIKLVQKFQTEAKRENSFLPINLLVETIYKQKFLQGPLDSICERYLRETQSMPREGNFLNNLFLSFLLYSTLVILSIFFLVGLYVICLQKFTSRFSLIDFI